MERKILLLLIMLCVISLFFQNSFASSSFPRQEILDNKRDWRDQKSNEVEQGDHFTDLVIITYLSDGKNFNATFWLAGMVLATPPRDMVSYGILIDADADSKTGLFGFDYASEIIWDGETWTRKLEERTRFNNIRVLDLEKNFTGFFDVGEKTVRLSFNLNSIGLPEEYSVVFFTLQEKKNGNTVKTLYDASALVNIPPPEFFISTSPDSIIIKQGEKKTIQVQVKSTTGFQPKVSLKTNPIENISFNFTSNELLVPSFGIAATPLEIKVSENAFPRPYMLVIQGNATFPLNKIIREEFNKTKFLQLEEDIIIQKTVPVTLVVEKFTVEDFIVEFTEKWQVLIFTLATLATGGFLFALKDRIAKRFKKRHQDEENSE